jgi:hypothetical protein
MNIAPVFRLLFLFVCSLGFAKEISFFLPPDGWTPAPRDALAPLVKVGFLEPRRFGFRSSLNLAEEDVDCNLKEYLEAVKAIHAANRHQQWTYLGEFQTKAGTAALTQLDTTTSWGAVRMLQLIFVQNAKAYILTAASSQNQFPKLLKIFKEALGSFSITEDLLSVIRDDKKRTHLCDLQTAAQNGQTEDCFEQFQKDVLKNFKDLGAYWQALVIAETIEKRKSLTSSPTIAAGK